MPKQRPRTATEASENASPAKSSESETMTRMPAPASAPKRPTEIIVSCESSATATPMGARSRRIGAGRMLIRTVNITHSAPERTWNAPPETDEARIVASTCTTTMIVKRSVGMAREPTSVSTSGIGPARETYSVTLRSSAGARALHERKRRSLDALRVERGEPLAGRPAGERQVRCEVAQRAQHELALVGAGVRQRQARVVARPRRRTRPGRGRACAAPSARRGRGRAPPRWRGGRPAARRDRARCRRAATAFRNGGWSVSPTGSER